jgi:nicotinamidase-related amidase
MSDSRNPHAGIEALLTPQDCVLLLIDHQAFQFANLHSHEPTLIVNNVAGLAKSAKAFKVPTILTTVMEERGGLLIKDVQDIFPDQKPINRTFINAWEDKRVVEAVKKTGRKKLVIASLWTEMCLAMPAIQAQGEGYDVYVVIDASGGVSVEAHDVAIRRMVQAGVTPVTWIAVFGQWQRDWARTETLGAVAEVITQHGGASGIAFAWEMQLLNSKTKAA